MDYSNFRKRIGNDLDIPNEEQKRVLIQGENSIHISVGIGYFFEDEECISRDIVYGGEVFVHALDMLEERSAVRGKDYIITVYPHGKNLICSLHSLNTFLSDEDFPNDSQK